MILSSLHGLWQLPLIVLAAMAYIWSVNLQVRGYRDERPGFFFAAAALVLVGVTLVVIAS